MTVNSELWIEFKNDPSELNKKKIMLQYLNLVHYVIQNTKLIRSTVIDEKDFFQFGIEGLNEAVDRFDPEFGTKFETYAIQRIRGRILDEIRRHQKKVKLDDETEVKQVNVSLNESYMDEDGPQLYETMADDNDTPEESFAKNETKQLLLDALQNLNERDRLIITLYYYEELGYKEIADLLKITVSRVSQIHTRVTDELRKAIQGR